MGAYNDKINAGKEWRLSMGRWYVSTVSVIGFQNTVRFQTFEDARNFALAYSKSDNYASAEVIDDRDDAVVWDADDCDGGLEYVKGGL